jgi:L-rhamnose isomerase/sugar isomerase
MQSIAIGRALGCKALAIRIGDGLSVPGQSPFTRLFERVTEAVRGLYAELPDDWRLYIEGAEAGPAEPPGACDLGTSFLLANAIGDRALCSARIGGNCADAELIAKLIQSAKLGAVCFTGPELGRAFLVLNDLVDAELSGAAGFNPSYVIGSTKGLGDPIETVIAAAMDVQRSYVQAHLVDREMLARFQEQNDPVMAGEMLGQAFRIDVEPVLAMARLEKDAAIDPIATYRASGYRQKVAEVRPRPYPAGVGLF